MVSDNKNLTYWQKVEVPLKMLAQRIKLARLLHKKKGDLTIEYYYCQSVMDLAQFLRKNTKAQDTAAQHHTLKILFRFVNYDNEAHLEYRIQDKFVDIFLKTQNKIVEVKTITQMTMKKLYQKVIGVLNAEPLEVDILWVFFFYKLVQPSPHNPDCQYLLTFISIDLVGQEKEALKWELSQMVEETKVLVAEKLKLTPELLIPLENLLKVEDLERELAEEKQNVLEEKQNVLKEKQKVAEKDQEILKLKTLLHSITKPKKRVQ